MSYYIQETRPDPEIPPVDRLQLEVDGEVVAQAFPAPADLWRVAIAHSGLRPIEFANADHAREFLTWLGEKLSPLTVINGPEDLDRAPVGSIWKSKYNGGNKYRKRDDGAWEFKCPGSDEWDTAHFGPYLGAYPLRAKS